MSIILGIDPGLGHTGWGVIRKQDNKLSFIACGTISSNTKLSLAQRLLTIKNGLQTVIDEHSPNECAIEETFVNKNPLSSLKLGHARGAAILTCSLNGINPHEYAATLVKKTIVVAGRADKSQIAIMVKTLLPKAIITSEDAADALAVALCHTQHQKMHNILEKA
jgi:crossover junction endodeoxyribonuclease RuvC